MSAPPDFIILGAMRSGTTSLWRYLSNHSAVYMAPKELGYFTEHLDRGFDWYEQQFARAGAHQVRGEATADYLARPPALKAIAEQAPQARLVALLRNPVPRAWSHYWLLRERGVETRGYEEAFSSDLAAAGDPLQWREGFSYLQHGAYDEHLTTLFELVAPDLVDVLITEEMADAPHEIFARVCRFIGVDATEIPEVVGRQVNSYVSIRSPLVRRFAKQLPAPVAAAVARLNTRSGARYPELPESLRERLTDFYAPRVSNVEETLSRRIGPWRTGPFAIES